MSSTGTCFDIGVATCNSLAQWRTALCAEYDLLRPDSKAAIDAFESIEAKIQQAFSQERHCGNGSLMRVLPTALVARNRETAADLARATSQPTHPHPRCQDACDIYACLVHAALTGSTKEELACQIHSITSAPDSTTTATTKITDSTLLRRLQPYHSLSNWTSKPSHQILSTGYVVDTLEASLWAFFLHRQFPRRRDPRGQPGRRRGDRRRHLRRARGRVLRHRADTGRVGRRHKEDGLGQ